MVAVHLLCSHWLVTKTKFEWIALNSKLTLAQVKPWPNHFQGFLRSVNKVAPTRTNSKRRKTHSTTSSCLTCCDHVNGLPRTMVMATLHSEESTFLPSLTSACEFSKNNQWFSALMHLSRFLVTFTVSIKT